MQLRPILSSLQHHKVTVALLILQVALTCAIECNIGFIMVNSVDRITRISGVAEDELSLIDSRDIGSDQNNHAQQVADLTALRTIPGVIAAAAVDSLPLGGDESTYGICSSKEDLARVMAARSFEHIPGCVQPSEYDGSPDEIKALGLQLIAGRDFSSEEYFTDGNAPTLIMSRSLAERLYPRQNALGRIVYTGAGNPIRVVGIVDTLLRPRLREPKVDQFAMLWPQWPGNDGVTYLLRSQAQDRERVLKAAVGALMRINPNRIIPSTGIRTFAQMRSQYFQHDMTMISLLLTCGFALLFVTALGIAGLANFWVQQRKRHIGIRRAIGATRGDILCYFQTENFLVVTFGVIPGMLLAYALNTLLMRHYELSRLPLYYLPLGAVILWLLGQLAVLGPALRAAAVPPIAATRLMD
ncbi:ABC transporter permease [Dyella caseinilytica]|uniref:FtsX-like permease family protein n=1 Tax=Dyella caseinilytica TaxID=1849581 RepID=A0ABX7GX62_9GAMM|nr:FtsX-like permease family protein [Dyella caseinilytica]QRN54900.1 FtsX-like permease family protein [Dyella caseinilytica]GFZ97773.1 ABC transporter permease [Dyella caseinilytica]